MEGQTPSVQQKTIWDRKTDGGFPETKELKRRVRDVIQPERNLGHVDRDYHSKKPSSTSPEAAAEMGAAKATEAAPAPAPQSTSNKTTECADCDNWMTEETYKGDFEGGHAGGSGSGSGQQQSKGETAGESGESEKRTTADSNWMTEETYKDLEGGQ